MRDEKQDREHGALYKVYSTLVGQSVPVDSLSIDWESVDKGQVTLWINWARTGVKRYRISVEEMGAE